MTSGPFCALARSNCIDSLRLNLNLSYLLSLINHYSRPNLQRTVECPATITLVQLQTSSQSGINKQSLWHTGYGFHHRDCHLEESGPGMSRLLFWLCRHALSGLETVNTCSFAFIIQFSFAFKLAHIYNVYRAVRRRQSERYICIVVLSHSFRVSDLHSHNLMGIF